MQLYSILILITDLQVVVLMEFRLLEYFLAVASEENISADEIAENMTMLGI